MLGQGGLAALNHLLLQADWARARLAPHAGRKVRVLLRPAAPSWKLDFCIDETGTLAAASFDGADVDILLPEDALWRALRGHEELARGVHVRGAAELADALNFVLPRLRWDAEEDLSRLVGDIAAHRLVQGARGFVAWQRDAAERLAQNFAEYLTEEQPLLARRVELERFGAELAELSLSLERLAARVQRAAA